MPGLMIAVIALSGLSCAGGNTATKDTLTRAEHEKFLEDYEKGLEESKKIVVARVNGAEITKFELLRRMGQLSPKYVPSGQNASPEVNELLKKESLDVLIFRELAIQEAVRQGMTVRPEAITHLIEEMLVNMGSEDAFEEYLKRRGLTEGSLRREIERDRLFNMIASEEIFNKIKIDEDLIVETYEKKKAGFQMPPVAFVEDVIIVKGEDEASATRKANEVVAYLREHDNDPSKLTQDGAFSVKKSALTEKGSPGLYKVASAMNEGQLSGVIDEKDGLHIMRLVKREPARTMTLDEARGFIQDDLTMAQADKRKQEWEAQLKKNAKIEIIPGEGEKD